MAEKTKELSYFDGGLFGLICVSILSGILTLITLGLAFPWAVCLKMSWVCSHTVVDGRRLAFAGRGLNLFIEWLKILGLCIITLGIYGFWANIAIHRWVVKNTHSGEDSGQSPFPF